MTKKERGDKPALISTFALRANFDLRLALQPSIDVLPHHILGETVAMLDHTFKLFALSVDLSQIVIGELAPLLFDPALSLFPISCDAVPVHVRLRGLNPQVERCDMPGSSARVLSSTADHGAGEATTSGGAYVPWSRLLFFTPLSLFSEPMMVRNPFLRFCAGMKFAEVAR